MGACQPHGWTRAPDAAACTHHQPHTFISTFSFRPSTVELIQNRPSAMPSTTVLMDDSDTHPTHTQTSGWCEDVATQKTDLTATGYA